MLRLPFLLFLFHGVAEAFVGPTVLSGRANAVYTRRWGTGANRRRTRPAYLAPQESIGAVVSTPKMSLTLGNVGQILADGESDAGSMPISSETQDNIISALSVASSLLLFTIIGVSAYLTFMEWKSKRDMDKTEKYIKETGSLPPTDALADPANGSNDDEESGNRRYRRLAKKEKLRGRL